MGEWWLAGWLASWRVYGVSASRLHLVRPQLFSRSRTRNSLAEYECPLINQANQCMEMAKMYFLDRRHMRSRALRVGQCTLYPELLDAESQRHRQV